MLACKRFFFTLLFSSLFSIDSSASSKESEEIVPISATIAKNSEILEADEQGYYFMCHDLPSSWPWTQETCIMCMADERTIGFLSVTKIMSRFAVLHTLYIYPTERGKGYGRALIQEMLDSLKAAGIWRAYIQPGPFELMDGGHYTQLLEDRADRIERLIHLYAKAGFRPVNRVFSLFMAMIYWLLSIHEDPSLLMVQKF